MTLARTRSVVMVGLTGHVVEVEAHLGAGLPAFTLIGLPDASLSEAKDRIRAAFSSSGLTWPNRRMTVNLSPASLPKTGSALDLAVAVAVMGSSGLVGTKHLDAVYLGELGLDGRVRPVRGVLPAVAAALRAGQTRVVVPWENQEEALLVPGIQVIGTHHLAEVAHWFGADVPVPVRPEAALVPPTQLVPNIEDLSDVLGQSDARRGVEIAAAGGHHMLLVGPPGAGKTMLARRLPGLLPDLDDQAAVEVTSVHSVSGTLAPGIGLIRRPPFEAPHHTATAAAIVGGGAGIPRPGAASRAHHGVLFLDEAPHFSTQVLQTLRQPLEHGELLLHRALGSARYPAQFQLVLAANPCPCGQYWGKGSNCTCRVEQRRRYFGKLSGPLLDRVDLQIEVGPARVDGALGEDTATVAERVHRSRLRAAARWADTSWSVNAQVPGSRLRQMLGRSDPALKELDRAVERGWLSLRGADRTLRVAWTIADLAGEDSPGTAAVGEAMALRGRAVNL